MFIEIEIYTISLLLGLPPRALVLSWNFMCVRKVAWFQAPKSYNPYLLITSQYELISFPSF